MKEDRKELLEEIKEEHSIVADAVSIQGMIYVVRGKQVMLDSDLAILYQVETKNLNKAMKRNIARFPEDFCFQLSTEEYSNLKFHFGTSSRDNDENGHGGRRTPPYVFTEQGISMLSSVLRSDVAINISITIMRTFIEMRKYMENTSLLYDRINEIEVNQKAYQIESNEKFNQVFKYISDHEESQQKVFYDGQIYDAFSLIIRIISDATSKIILVDNYVNTETLNILAKKQKDVAVTIYTDRRTKLTHKDVEVFNKQYPKLRVRHTNAFHDRFLIIDENKAYHVGASLKDVGRKCFAITLLNDKGIIYDLMQRLNIETEEQE